MLLCAMEHLIDYHNNAVQFSDILSDTCPHINTQYSRMDGGWKHCVIVYWKYIMAGSRWQIISAGFNKTIVEISNVE